MVLSRLGYRLLMQDEADLSLNTNGKSMIAAPLCHMCEAIDRRVSKFYFTRVSSQGADQLAAQKSWLAYRQHWQTR